MLVLIFDYTVCFLSARSRGIELWCTAKITIPIRTIRGKIRGPSVSQPSELSANTHDEVEQRRRCYIIIASRCLASPMTRADKTIRLLSRKREREGTIWQERLVFNPADDQFLFLPVVFSQFDCRPRKLPANRKGNKGKVVLFESRERKCLIFFFIAKILLCFLDKDFFATYFFFVPIFRRYATSMISKRYCLVLIKLSRLRR